MDLTLAGISAFRFYRVPPQVLALLPPVAQARDYGRRGLYGHPLVGEALGGTPLTCLATARRQSTGARWINWTLVQGELPFGHVLDTDFSIGVTSPALTLITLGRKLSVTRLAMAAYELTGYFSVFCPSDEMEEALASNAGMLRDSGVRSWHRVPREDGRRGDLWQRAPLADLDELASFARVNAKLRGAGKLAEALSLVNGVVASPFEARLSALLTFPRRLGGCALEGFENNRKVVLDATGRTLSNKNACYVDLYHPGAPGGRPLAVECQGGAIHTLARAALDDADRQVALRGMGIDVIPVTYRQVRDVENYHALAGLIAGLCGRKLPSRTSQFVRAENALRHEILGDWAHVFD